MRHVLQFEGAYKHIDSDVLKPCVREINKHADISLGYRGIKKGRAVAAILFSIERTAVQIQMPFDDIEGIEAGDETALLPDDLLTLSLIEMGVAKRKAKEIVEAYENERIRENLAYVEKEYEAGKVKNLTVYLIRAIEENYRQNKTSQRRRREIVEEEDKKQQAERQAVKEIKREWKQYRSRRVRERFAALASDKQKELRRAFVTSLQKTNKFLRQVQKGGV